MANPISSGGLVIAAPSSGAGKTTFTLGLVAALRQQGVRVAAAKTGPDYIDATYLGKAAGGDRVLNLDAWAMRDDALKARAARAKADNDLLIVEGVMGLFDGAQDGTGSTADLAATLALPVLLVVDASRQSQSIAALVSGFANWREDINIAGVILNKVGSDRHTEMLRAALADLPIPVLGAIPRDEHLHAPSRHLGLVLPAEITDFERTISRAADMISNHCDLAAIMRNAAPLPAPTTDAAPTNLPPLGQHIAIARDQAFAFIYTHWLDEWQAAGATLSFFSPLADQGPDQLADAVFLPGGYPELHGQKLSQATNFQKAMRAAQHCDKLIYGECGGYMVLGKSLTDQDGTTHPMCNLLPHETHIDRPKRVLGYRVLEHASPLPFPKRLTGHEFHYSSSSSHALPPLFTAKNALGEALEPMGAISGRVMGAYAHVIDGVSA